MKIIIEFTTEMRIKYSKKIEEKTILVFQDYVGKLNKIISTSLKEIKSK